MKSRRYWQSLLVLVMLKINTSGITNGVCRVKSVYKILKLQADARHPLSSGRRIYGEFWRNIWKLKIPPKIQNFIWRAARNALATKVNLFTRKLTNDDLCPICNSVPETIVHLLFGCEHSKKVWFASSAAYRPNSSTIPNFAEWWRSISALISDQCTLAEVTIICWNLWKARNDWTFKKIKPNTSFILRKSNLLVQELFDSGLFRSSRDVSHPTTSWKPPPIDCLKINCDASFLLSSKMGNVAAICRSWNGSVVDARVRKVYCDSCLQAESYGLLTGIQLAISLGVNKVIFESDNETLIKVMNKEEEIP